MEPSLQQLTNEVLSYRSANREDGARLDVVAEDFWGPRQHAFFDVRVFNPIVPNLCTSSIPALYRQKEQRRAYDERVRQMEFSSFTPLVFTTSGGMGSGAHVVYRSLASMITNHHQKSSSIIINSIRCRITFSLLRSALMYLRTWIKITQIHTTCA